MHCSFPSRQKSKRYAQRIDGVLERSKRRMQPERLKTGGNFDKWRRTARSDSIRGKPCCTRIRIRGRDQTVEGLNGRLTLHATRQRHSFCDSRRSEGTNLIGQSEKQVGIPHFSKNFHDTFILPIFSTADDETVSKNLVLTYRTSRNRDLC